MHTTSPPAAHVLVVDDHPTMRHILATYLTDHDMRVSAAAGRGAMVEQFGCNEPDLVILDLLLGHDDGLDVLREIRSRSSVPVIISTGHRCDEIDRVVGLELGADDYVTKPFGLRELLARIRGVLRRRKNGRGLPQRDGGERGVFHFGTWQFDRRTRRLTRSDGTPVLLTKGEYALLLAFVGAPLRPLSRAQLLQATLLHEDVFDRSIDVQVLWLRRKLESDPSAPRVIQTERGVGYLLTLPVELER